MTKATLELLGSPKKLTEPVSRLWARRDEFMKLVADQLVANTHERFDRTKSDPDGRKWAPWAESTRRAYQKSGHSGSLLVRTGALRNSIRSTAGKKQASVSSNLKYGQYIQQGTDIMPARPFIGIGQKDVDSFHEIWEKWINQ